MGNIAVNGSPTLTDSMLADVFPRDCGLPDNLERVNLVGNSKLGMSPFALQEFIGRTRRSCQVRS